MRELFLFTFLVVGLVAPAEARWPLTGDNIVNARAPTMQPPKELRRVVNSLNAFWKAYTESNYSIRFEPPRIIFYTPSTFPDANGVAFYESHNSTLHLNLAGDPNFVTFVLSHEYGHHIQNVVGWSRYYLQQRYSNGRSAVRRLDLRYELQAECLSGMWVRNAVGEEGALSSRDLDTFIEREKQYGDSPSHGRLRQRLKWFATGYEMLNSEKCDTFAPSLGEL